MATASSNESTGEPEGGERLGGASLQSSDTGSNNYEQNSSRQANSAELPRVDAVSTALNKDMVQFRA